MPPASAVSHKLPSWIRIGGEVRDREEGRTSLELMPGRNDTYNLTRLRLNLTFSPKNWFDAFVQGQDSHAIGMDPSRANGAVKNIFDFRQAYFDLKTGENTWLRLRTGRQELNFGAQRVLGGGDWSNTTRTYDAVRLTLGRADRHVDLLAASPVLIYPTRLDHRAAGKNLYGGYGSLSKIVPQATIEPYFFLKTLPSVKGKDGRDGAADIYTAGVRWVGKLPASFDYQAEVDLQTGHVAHDALRAWAGYGVVGYSVPHVPWKPRLSSEYGYSTGDNGRMNGKIGTFDQVYAALHNVYGMSDLFGERNMRHTRAGMEVKPTAKVTADFDYHFLNLANARDGLYNSAGVMLVKAVTGGAKSTQIGTDAEVYLTYAVRPWLTAGTGYGHLFSGRFLTENGRATGSSYPYAFLTYRF
jgi:hypothetical protein